MISDGRTPSPNYFGLSMDKHGDLGDSAGAPLHNNWSPHSSSVKSFNAAIPKPLPLDANPEFEAFKRQVNANKAANGFNLSGSYFTPCSSFTRPPPLRRPTNQSDVASDASIAKSAALKPRDLMGGQGDVDGDSLHDSAYVSSDSKRNSEVSLHASLFGMPRFESPALTESPFEPMGRGTLSKGEDRQSRLSLPHNKAEDLAYTSKPRSETLPPALETAAPGLLLPSELKALLRDTTESEVLLLDVRVATLYAQSRIPGALNLCIPTTLLKRATFNLDKLQKTLQTEEDQAKFGAWADAKYLVIYDNASNERRDAAAAMNMFKKFMNDDFAGRSCLLKGGFQAFVAAYPNYVDYQPGAERGGTSVASSQGGRPSFAPVIGGVSLPSTANNPNPFFGNIRQNMDLADGVGQMDIRVPPSLDSTVLPRWLREATQESDHGKKVSDRFLNIERREQSRMRDAYSAFNTTTPSSSKPGRVQLCGVEKGVKNRYKDILPFEHARVRLAGLGAGDCDYINASHVQASRSHKRYIAAQGPLPATYEDFWSVVWDQDVRVIVMLTAEQEGGQLKCHPYWQGREFGTIKLTPLSEKKVSLDMDKYTSTSSPASSATANSEAGRRRANTTTTIDPPGSVPNQKQQSQSQGDSPYVIIRKFAMCHASHPFEPMREITHLHYPSWPDFGTPAQPSHLLALVELANVMQRSALPLDANAVSVSVTGDHQSTMSWFDEPESEARARPLLVHCSAGCGRTGTFCTVDSVIDMLKRQRLASLGKRMRRDTDGDVAMGDRAASPKKAKHCNPPEERPEDSQADAGWVGETDLDLIEATVEDFRTQRLSMVQSLRQFVLCYESITEWVWRLQEKNGGVNNRGRLRSGSLQRPT
jgi:protein tyrosine phosphatase/rhodanese-related sulfurtransferase